ncbi:MAG TPA: GNAT family N-acetyltransferase [Candidatus Krumholzibacteria bacterium]
MSGGKEFEFTASFESAGQVFRVRPVEAMDIEVLRIWKNTHRAVFFHKDIISPEQQAAWFEAFSARTNEQIFVLEHGQRLVACIGFRTLEEGVVEMFNLILGAEDYRGRGALMSTFYLNLEYGLVQRGVDRIELRVLPDNERAISFYRRNGYRVVQENDRFLLMDKRIR